jgi:outer membrane protein assembly factor BamB
LVLSPVVVDRVLYGMRDRGKDVVLYAADAATGEAVWRFEESGGRGRHRLRMRRRRAIW